MKCSAKRLRNALYNAELASIPSAGLTASLVNAAQAYESYFRPSVVLASQLLKTSDRSSVDVGIITVGSIFLLAIVSPRPNRSSDAMLRAAILTLALVLNTGMGLSNTGMGLSNTSWDVAAAASGPPASVPLKRADFRGEPASSQARHVADVSVRSGDHKSRPFIVIDKADAKLFAFDRNARLIRATPVLLGMGIGDTFPPGVIEMEMSALQPSQRITPAGRFEAEDGENLAGERVLRVFYDAGIAIHKLPMQKTPQRRQERLASPTSTDNRITYGCINVPPSFYDEVIQRYFASGGGIVYVLPERPPAKPQTR